MSVPEQFDLRTEMLVQPLKGVRFEPVTANPGDAATFWVKKSDGHAQRGSTDLEAATGDMVGPASSRDNAIVRYNGTTGKLVQNSNICILDGDTDEIQLDANVDSANEPLLTSNWNSYSLYFGIGAGPADRGLTTSTTCLGTLAGGSLQAAASYNTLVGTETAYSLTSGTGNTVTGAGAAFDLTTGNNNTITGQSAASNLTTGSSNVVVARNMGGNLTTGSSNIYLGGEGSVNESSTIRIGAAQTDCYVQGIHLRNPAISVPRKLVSIDSDGKLYGMTLGQANPFANGYFENYNAPYSRTCVVDDTYYPVAQALTLTSPGSYFTTPSAGIIQYDGVDTVTLKATVNVSTSLASSSDNNIGFAIYKDAVIVPGSQVVNHLGVISDRMNCTITCFITSVATNSQLQLYVKNIDGTATISFPNINITYEAMY
jgi:hypothetical protein